MRTSVVRRDWCPRLGGPVQPALSIGEKARWLGLCIACTRLALLLLDSWCTGPAFLLHFFLILWPMVWPSASPSFKNLPISGLRFPSFLMRFHATATLLRTHFGRPIRLEFLAIVATINSLSYHAAILPWRVTGMAAP